MKASDMMEKTVGSLGGGLAQLRHLISMKGQILPAAVKPLEDARDKLQTLVQDLSQLSVQKPGAPEE